MVKWSKVTYGVDFGVKLNGKEWMEILESTTKEMGWYIERTASYVIHNNPSSFDPTFGEVEEISDGSLYVGHDGERKLYLIGRLEEKNVYTGMSFNISSPMDEKEIDVFDTTLKRKWLERKSK